MVTEIEIKECHSVRVACCGRMLTKSMLPHNIKRMATVLLSRRFSSVVIEASEK